MQLKMIESAHRAQIYKALSRIPRGVPQGWQKVELSVPAAGLTHIGFSEASPNRLVCVSPQAQSVVNCRTGEVRFCAENYDEDDLIALADELGDEIVHLAGINGGGLRRSTRQGEGLWLESPLYPKQQVIYSPSFKIPFETPEACTLLTEDYGPLVCGFSRCGRFLAVMSAAELLIYKRKN